MGNCKSVHKIVCESSSPWLEYQDENGNVYWYNYMTGNYTYEPQRCDWSYETYEDAFDGVWYNRITGEMRNMPPVSHAQLWSDMVEAQRQAPTAIPVAVSL